MDKVNELIAIFGIPESPGRAFDHLSKDLKKVAGEKNISAYYRTRAMVFDWINDDDKRYRKPTRKGNAKYYYKIAMHYGDLRAAYRYLKKYYEMGGRGLFDLSINLAHPLSSIDAEMRRPFRQSLAEKDNQIAKDALATYL